ncbi:4322_t:CDS:2 [Scutellospora calospora]|uniref:4322_t:CDS:1 n=1 Tax=Scutellospora calospora TaxID=85575 RepID=A0ACA9KUN4_9GLOM|nr:4322_t:CDS:2 [Scutellospora calospora]
MSDKESDLPEEDSLFFDSYSEASDNMSVGSGSRAVSIVSLENQLCATKKSKLPKRRWKYVKSSWVWKYFKVNKNGQHDICTVEILNLNNETVKCGHKFLHDGSTGNMSSHLQNKHDLYENKNKITSDVQDNEQGN